MNPADAALIERLRREVHSVLGRVLAGAEACALLDFPRHRNSGDSAIWTGEVTALRAAGVAVRATCDRDTYSRERLRRAVGDHPILLHGGGNFGDLYSTHQALREQILTDFRGHPAVQLTQSIHFNDRANLDRMRRVIADHGAVTMIVRDKRSEAIAREHFDARIELCPDLAFAIGPIARPRPAAVPLIRQARIDKEAAPPGTGTGAGDPAPVPTFDWLAPPSSPRTRVRFAAADRLLALLVGGGRLRDRGLLPTGTRKRAYDAYARQNVDRATRMLSVGDVVVTDRLHGHILCTLLGIPHVVMDDRYGKTSNFYSCWTSEVTSARFARDWSEAAAHGDELLRLSRDGAATGSALPTR